MAFFQLGFSSDKRADHRYSSYVHQFHTLSEESYRLAYALCLHILSLVFGAVKTPVFQRATNLAPEMGRTILRLAALFLMSRRFGVAGANLTQAKCMAGGIAKCQRLLDQIKAKPFPSKS